jgi:uncharacterized protein YecT (DUF1311 family)
MMRVCVPVLVLSCGGALAQDLPFSAEPIEACLGAAQSLVEKQACIGAGAAACIDTPDGYTTVGMGFCYRHEASYWDDRLNTAFAALMSFERALKAEIEGLGGFAPDAPNALRNMQRAWIGYRDATCAYEYSTWGGGTGGGPANAACLMTETARQAIVLERRLSDRNQ